MTATVSDLLRERIRIETRIGNRVADLWSVLQSELGISAEFKTTSPGIRLGQATIGLEVSVRGQPTPFDEKRVATHVFEIPPHVLDLDSDSACEVLRRLFPLQCTECGLVQPLGSTACRSAAGCWERLVWRREAPKPAYYVEERATWGYFDAVPARGLRFVVELATNQVLRIEYTLRNRERWVIPTYETQQKILKKLEATIKRDLHHALDGRISRYADPACFKLELPGWCDGPAQPPSTYMHVSRLHIRAV